MTKTEQWVPWTGPTRGTIKSDAELVEALDAALLLTDGERPTMPESLAYGWEEDVTGCVSPTTEAIEDDHEERVSEEVADERAREDWERNVGGS